MALISNHDIANDIATCLTATLKDLGVPEDRLERAAKSMLGSLVALAVLTERRANCLPCDFAALHHAQGLTSAKHRSEEVFNSVLNLMSTQAEQRLESLLRDVRAAKEATASTGASEPKLTVEFLDPDKGSDDSHGN